jgi:hypothetical protein
VLPDKKAVAVTEGDRAQQGLTRDPVRHPTGGAATRQNAAITLGVQTRPAVAPSAVARVSVPSGELNRIHISELVTFVAGLGAGALVAMQSTRHRDGHNS